MEWVAVVLAGVSLLVSSVTLLVATRILRTARRSELAGDERLEILREQQQRLDYLHEERRALLGTLELLQRETPPRRPSSRRNGAIPGDDDVEAYERAFASLRAFEQMNEAVELLMRELSLGRGPEEFEPGHPEEDAERTRRTVNPEDISGGVPEPTTTECKI